MYAADVFPELVTVKDASVISPEIAVFEIFGFEIFGLEIFGLEMFGLEMFGFEIFGLAKAVFEIFGFEMLGFETSLFKVVLLLIPFGITLLLASV